MILPQLPATNRAGKLGTILMIVFLAPFCLIGIVTAVMAMQSLMEGDYHKGGFLGIFALVFGGMGIGMMALVIEGRRGAEKGLALRTAHPAEPWKWREDWAASYSRSLTKSTLVYAWAFAVFWNLISTPLLLILPSEVSDKGNYAALFGLLFPLVGIGLLIWAVRETLEWKKFGPAVFQMNAVPGVLGGELSGTIHVPAGIEPGQTFDITCSCINRRTTGSGKNASTTEIILWQEKQEALQSIAHVEASGSGIPVRFAIPYACSPCDDSNRANLILWRLEGHAAVPGIDFDAQFEVPVFRTAASSPSSPGEQSAEEVPPTYRPTPGAGIAIEPTPSGGTAFIIKPKRPLSPIVSMAVFLVVWSGVIAGMIVLGVPLLFPLIFGAFELIFLYAILQLSLGWCRIVIDGSTLSIDNMLAGFPMRTVIPVDEIEVIEPSIGVQSGKTVLYSLTLTRRGGRHAFVRVALGDKHDAVWLAGEITMRIRSH